MKSYIFLLLVIILTAGIGCKKNNQPDAPVTPKKVVVTTIAGEGTGAFADGPALSAKFNKPWDVAVWTDGTLYVSDLNNSRIRKITAGLVSTYAGSGTYNILNGPGSTAQFKYPYFLALDANGNLYTSDLEDPRIRRISPAADVSTYAGLATLGFGDGGVAIAQFWDSERFITDLQGNVYVSDTYNQRIRKISTSGIVSTIAGSDTAGFRDGSGGTARFNNPKGMAIDKQGNIYVADASNYRIRVITPAGVVSTFAGSGILGVADGTAALAQFNSLNDMVFDSQGNLYVTDDQLIRKISPQGIVSTIAGGNSGYADGDGSSARFSDPVGLAIDTHDNIYVADAENNRIRKISFE